MIDSNARNLAVEVRNLPPSMLDASLLAEYVKPVKPTICRNCAKRAMSR
jgi:hypothetical protein